LVSSFFFFFFFFSSPSPFEEVVEREKETSDKEVVFDSFVMLGCGGVLSSSKLVRGSSLCASVSVSSSSCPSSRQQRLVCRAEAKGEAKSTEERFRLNNLSPAPGSKREKKRIGRGYGAGQGGSAGKGMRGQNARSGGGTRPGFEGGQNPLYRRLPKLKGIAGGMGAGQKDYNVVNVGLLSECFEAGEEVTLEILHEKRVLDVSGKKRKLPLKVLGDGDLDKKLVVKAGAFSKTASEKIAAAGGEVVELPGRNKWTREGHNKAKAAAEAAAASS
jgi:large subunit ribosomal protein L15